MDFEKFDDRTLLTQGREFSGVSRETDNNLIENNMV